MSKLMDTIRREAIALHHSKTESQTKDGRTLWITFPGGLSPTCKELEIADLHTIQMLPASDLGEIEARRHDTGLPLSLV